MLKIVLALGLLAFVCTPLRAADQVSPQTLVKKGQDHLAAGDTENALFDFEAAGSRGDAQGAFLAGDLLLTQAGQSTGRTRVEKSIDGTYYLFLAATNHITAATNHQANACADLAHAFRDGMGVQTNLVYAYAWLEFAAHLDSTYQPELDAFVLQLDPGQIDQAQTCAKDMQAGHWPDFNFQRAIEDQRVRVQGLAVGPHGPLVILNGTTFARGESGDVFINNGPHSTRSPRLSITCLDIGHDYVLVSVAGESGLHVLPMDNSSRP